MVLIVLINQGGACIAWWMRAPSRPFFRIPQTHTDTPDETLKSLQLCRMPRADPARGPIAIQQVLAERGRRLLAVH